jgi:hypothetical protein
MCTSLGSEYLDEIYSYSAFKEIFFVGWLSVNNEHCIPKIRHHSQGPQRQNVYILEDKDKDFD